MFYYGFAKSRYNNLWYCKLHQDKHPSLVCDDRRQIAKCLSQNCLNGADCLEVIKIMEGCNFNDAIKKAVLISRSIISPIFQDGSLSSKRKATKSNSDIIPQIHGLESRHKNYLQNHFGNDWKWIVNRFKLGAYYPHISVPISEESMVFLPINPYDKEYNPTGDTIYHRGKNRVPQVFPNTPKEHNLTKKIFLCEGEKDVMKVELALHHSGKSQEWNAISNTMGGQSLNENISLFKNFDREKVKEVMICFDNDKIGERANRIAYKLAKSYFRESTKITIFRFPKGVPKGYDIGDYINQKR